MNWRLGLRKLRVRAASAQVPDGTLKITRRAVSPGIGVEWDEGVLTIRAGITLLGRTAKKMDCCQLGKAITVKQEQMLTH